MQVASIQLFCKAAELGSFSAAAESLGITPAAVSRSVARIERRLGTQLFARSTRRVRLTDAGKLYFEQCRQALAQIEEAERAILGDQAQPSGALRISVPTTYGHFRVVPLLPEFRTQFPKVCLEVDISNRNIDLIEDGYDLAIRLGTPSDSRLVARKLEDAALGVYAAKSYLRQHGVPQTLADLERHHCFQFVRPSSGKVMPWIFTENNQEIERSFNTPIRFLGDILGCVYCAAAGGGLVQTYDFVISAMRFGDSFVEVLQHLRGRTRPFSILYPHSRHLRPSTRAFVNFMIAKRKGRDTTHT